MTHGTNLARQWLTFIVLSFAWGSSFLFIKIGVEHVGPFTLVAGRFWIGWLAISVLFFINGGGFPATRNGWGKLLFLGLLNTAIPIYLIAWGEQNIDSGPASILNSTVPIWTVLLAHFMLHDEKLHLGRILGIVVGFVGILVLIGRPQQFSGNMVVAGQLAVILATVCYGLGAIFVRRFLSGIPLLQIIWVSLLSASLSMTAMALVIERPDIARIHPTSFIAMLWLGVVGTALAYPLYYKLIGWWGAGRATTVTYAMPVIGTALGVIILAEPLTIQMISGAVLILAGVIQTNRG